MKKLITIAVLAASLATIGSANTVKTKPFEIYSIDRLSALPEGSGAKTALNYIIDYSHNKCIDMSKTSKDVMLNSFKRVSKVDTIIVVDRNVNKENLKIARLLNSSNPKKILFDTTNSLKICKSFLLKAMQMRRK